MAERFLIEPLGPAHDQANISCRVDRDLGISGTQTPKFRASDRDTHSTSACEARPFRDMLTRHAWPIMAHARAVIAPERTSSRERNRERERSPESRSAPAANRRPSTGRAAGSTPDPVRLPAGLRGVVGRLRERTEQPADHLPVQARSVVAKSQRKASPGRSNVKMDAAVGRAPAYLTALSTRFDRI